ncbi:MAG TPA: hypothetical protein VE053_08635 [Allosphingosinicella sp.]|nr:hypothetical protein [Allosphingosinicella sp.]
MRGRANSRHRQIGADAKGVFLTGLRDGLCREDAAAVAGFSLTGFYGARRRDPAFAAEWKAALALPPAAERRARAYEDRGEVRIAPANRRLFQRRRRRNVRFDAERREIYLVHFIATGDRVAAAKEAGVSPSTVDYHRRNDPAFAEAHQEALESCYVRLEVEAVRLRIAAKARLRAAVEAAGDSPSRALLAEEGAEFDRTMKLLDRLDRKPRRPESRFTPGGRRQAWTFDQAIRLLGKRMDALGVPRRKLPPETEDGG